MAMGITEENACNDSAQYLALNRHSIALHFYFIITLNSDVLQSVLPFCLLTRLLVRSLLKRGTSYFCIIGYFCIIDAKYSDKQNMAFASV